MPFKPAPLNASFMLSAILGFLISTVYVSKIDLTWAFAFSIVFFIMIIASLISMVQAPVRGQLMPQFEKEIRAAPKFDKAELSYIQSARSVAKPRKKAKKVVKKKAVKKKSRKK